MHQRILEIIETAHLKMIYNFIYAGSINYHGEIHIIN